jgi:hypothetical protein
LNLRLAAHAAAYALVLVVLTAFTAAALGIGPALRGWFRFDFSHSRTLSEFARIAINNARVVSLPLIGAVLLPKIGRWHFVLSAWILIVAIGNCLLIGLALAAYRSRLAAELFAHAPLELGAMAVASATYLDARANPVSYERLAVASISSLSFVIVAAAMEVWA